MGMLLTAELVLVGIGLPTALWMVSRGGALDRLVGLEVISIQGTLALLIFSELAAQPSYLIVPTIAAVLAFAGTLMFTRLLAPRP